MPDRRSALDPNALEDILTASSAQILALNATPKILVVAPGLTNYIIVDYVEAFNDHGGTDYVVNAAGVLVQYTGGGTIGTLTQAWGQASADQLATLLPAALNTIPENTALELQAGVANPTTGDGDWIIRVRYRIVTFA